MEPLFKRVILKQDKPVEDVFSEAKPKAYLYQVAIDCDERIKNNINREVKYTSGDIIDEDQDFDYILLHETSLLYFV